MKLLNDFLNIFEKFLKRLFIVLVATVVIPFIFISFLFGVWNFKIDKNDE